MVWDALLSGCWSCLITDQLVILKDKHSHTQSKETNRQGRGSENPRAGWGQDTFSSEEESVSRVRNEKLPNLLFLSIS